jgi:hypothetical protein
VWRAPTTNREPFIWTADHRGRALFEVDVDQLWDGVGPCLALPRTDLHRVLLAGAVISLHQEVER